MKLTSYMKSGLTFLSIVLFLPCLANATVLGTADLLYAGTGARDFVTVWGGTAEGTSMYAGNEMFQKLYGTGQGNLWTNYDVLGTFSMGLTDEYPSNPIKTYDVIMPANASFLGSELGLTKQKFLQELWGRYYDPSWSTVYNTSAQNAKAAIFALAVWEIVYEDYSGTPLNWDVTVDGTPGSSGFAADYTYASVANTWLHSLDGTGPRTDLRVFNIDGQNYLVAVPEPMTIILLSAGSLVLLKRKQRA